MTAMVYDFDYAIDRIVSELYKSECRIFLEEIEDEDTKTYDLFKTAFESSMIYHIIVLSHKGKDYAIEKEMRTIYEEEFGDINSYDGEEEIRIGKKQSKKWKTTMNESIEEIVACLYDDACDEACEEFRNEFIDQDEITFERYKEDLQNYTFYAILVLKHYGNETDIDTELVELWNDKFRYL